MLHRWFSSGRPLSLGVRVGMLVASLLLTSGFLLARSLNPDPRGFGTHQQLGLPECTFKILWNRPCPGCGMTTSFAHLVRGHLWAATRSNPAGVLLGAVCLIMVPWLCLCAWQGSTLGVDYPLETLIGLLAAVSGTSLIVWVQRLCW